jgi:lipid II:glycine glycyltransferase (peptidoglycan interpeptide bridge formation enzyme)
VKASLKRAVDKASQELTIERAHSISKEHEALISELLKREKLPPRVRELYRAMPDYVAQSSTACVLNARDQKKRLSAFYVVEMGAKNFSTYVLGSHSKKHYVPHASDLLFFEMIELTREHGKDIINLGLGVNEGIRRFKEKWGGVPFLNYEFCEHRRESTKITSVIRILEGKL